MDDVDRGNKYQYMSDGFASKAYYKKWYEKAYFAILDFMMLNAFFSWNMPAEDMTLNLLKVKKFALYVVCAEEMIAYDDNEYMYHNDDCKPIERYESHTRTLPNKRQCNCCVVYKLEEQWTEKVEKKDSVESTPIGKIRWLCKLMENTNYMHIPRGWDMIVRS